MGVSLLDHFPNLLVWALPASGKSEILAVLRGLNPYERLARLRVGVPVEIDDYARVAEWFKGDDSREARGEERLFTKKQGTVDGGFKAPERWDDLTRFLNGRYADVLQKNPQVHTTSTVLLECARGGSQGASLPLPFGYERALQVLDPSILRKAAILYVRVTPEESRRKNEARYNPNDPLCTLGHMVPRNVMLREYGRDDIDWLASSSQTPGYVMCGALRIPIGIFDNEKDFTSFVRDKNLSPEERERKTRELLEGLEKVCQPLFERYLERGEV